MRPYPKRFNGADRVARWYFDSVDHIVSVAADKGKGVCAAGAIKADELAGGSYYGTGSLAKVQADLLNPPKDIVAIIDEAKDAIRNRIELPVQPRRRVRHNLEQGDELDPVAWVTRNPDGWSDVLKERQTKRCIKIGVNINAPWSSKPNHLAWRGAAACALADCITELGHNVEVVVFEVGANISPDTKYGEFIELTVKPMNAPLDVAALAVSCASIAFTRCVMLTAKLRMVNTYHAGHGLGHTTHVSAEDTKNIDFMLEAQVCDKESAISYVLERVNQIRAELEVL